MPVSLMSVPPMPVTPMRVVVMPVPIMANPACNAPIGGMHMVMVVAVERDALGRPGSEQF